MRKVQWICLVLALVLFGVAVVASGSSQEEKPALPTTRPTTSPSLALKRLADRTAANQTPAGLKAEIERLRAENDRLRKRVLELETAVKVNNKAAGLAIARKNTGFDPPKVGDSVADVEYFAKVKGYVLDTVREAVDYKILRVQNGHTSAAPSALVKQASHVEYQFTIEGGKVTAVDTN